MNLAATLDGFADRGNLRVIGARKGPPWFGGIVAEALVAERILVIVRPSPDPP